MQFMSDTTLANMACPFTTRLDFTVERRGSVEGCRQQTFGLVRLHFHL
jgi:hypothetical protein